MNRHQSLAREVYAAAHLTGAFTLRSGTVSPEYFDKYRFEASPSLLREIATQLAERLPEPFDALAGLEMGGIPIAVMLSQVTGRPTRFIRKHAKAYGTCRFAEGGEVRGRRLMVVEDVVTSGGQVIESVEALRAEGALVTHVACVIDRESGGAARLSSVGLCLISLFTLSQLRAYA